jgi:hypothetical protein
MRIANSLWAFCFGCFVLFLAFPLSFNAQTQGREYVADFIRCSIEIETETWSQGKPIFVVVQVKNISDKAVSVLGTYSFELTTVSDDVPPMAYWSPVNILSGTPLKLRAGKVPEGAIHLEPGETKAMKFELTKLLWNKSISSVWPDQRLFEVVPKGNYDLIFGVETDRGKNSENIPIVTHIASNKVRIEVE